MGLNGSQYEALVNAIVDAFPDSSSLAMMLKFRLGRHLNAIVGPGPTTDQAFYLIQASEAEGWTEDLVAAARKSRPRNAMLLEVAQSVQLPTNVPSGPELQRIIRDTNRFHDITLWREAMAAIEGQVCRITVATNKGKPLYGTGFLVGPDLVMTNHHVIEAVIAGEAGTQTAKGWSARAAGVTCQFDYKKVAGYLDKGISVALAPDWLVDTSPVSPIDLEREPKSGDPDGTHLDYALLRLAQKVGLDAVKSEGERAERDAEPRGWITVPAGPADFEVDTPVFIVQHPDGAPLSFALDTSGMLGLNGNGTRVRYTTSTLGGSSGSPCFDQDWALVALHHSGDPNFDPVHKPSYNEGIPVSEIRRLLKTRGLDAVLDYPP